MVINIHLELEIQSCKAIYALRQKYGNHGEFVVTPLREIIYKKKALAFSIQELRKLGAAHEPFEMELYNLHCGTGTSKTSVKYALQSKPSRALWNLRYDMYSRWASAAVFKGHRRKATARHFVPGEITSLKNAIDMDRASYTCTLNVAVRTGITDADQAKRIFYEVAEVDPQTLGRLNVIGLRLA